MPILVRKLTNSVTQLVRKVLHEILITNKARGGLGYKTKFNFKWIPDLKNTTTPLGDPVPGQAQKSGPLRYAGVERTALMTLVFTGVVVGLAAWGGVRAATGLGWTNGYKGVNWDWESFSSQVQGLVRDVKLR
jgi:hypothetical protein